MRKVLLCFWGIAILSACNQDNKFHVSGTVRDAAGRVLYLEYSGLMKTTILDSVKLSADGAFHFSEKRPQYPDFYRLRLDNRVITFAVDSCENIYFKAQDKNFQTDYDVTGSLHSKQIQQLRKSLMKIQQKVDALHDMSTDERLVAVASIKNEINAHKEIAKKIILQNPLSTSAYFAIYQKVSDSFLFSPYVKEDRPYCAAVATSYNTYLPDFDRTRNLYGLVMDAIRSDRQVRSREVWDNVLEKEGKGYIDIQLSDRNGVVRKLSEQEGKVILLDFSSFGAQGSADYMFSLRELYDKYRSRGLQIYQVSLDNDKQIWEQSAQNLPWICVHDDIGNQSKVAVTYNITSLPTIFLIDKKGNIVGRGESLEGVEAVIRKLL